ncbi:Pyridoxal kinase [Smittium culicis]|uniref:pyridoxal kinase n=1 Tax=Smittium culicis TaxID=133412 RepID=A0A1R1Y4J7_9FUNG|nr:Pyridoxal kinase [Smittium culicis]
MPRVLSIQSHVVSGYVGNRAATFPMQYLGLDVDVINTVQLSNHTELFEGLEANGLDSYDFLLSGYMGNADNIKAVAHIAKRLSAKNPKFFFLLDTVLGDHGKMYVSEDLIELYKNELCPLANLVTPNQFEAELISGIKINTIKDTIDACNYFHNMGVDNVIISSSTLTDDADFLPASHNPADKMLHLIGSQFDRASKTTKAFRISSPCLPGYYTGAGDLLCALTISNISSLPTFANNPLPFGSLKEVCEQSLASQFTVIHNTMLHQKKSGIPSPAGLNQSQMSSALVKSFELQLIQSRASLANPEITYRAHDIL